MDVKVEPGPRPPARFDLEAARDALLDRLADRVRQLGRRRDDGAVGSSDHGVAAGLEPALGLRIHVDDAKVPVQRDVAVADGGEDIVQAGDAGGKLRIRSFGLVDVGDNADHPGDGAGVGAGQHAVPAPEPAVVAVGALDAQLMAQDLAVGGPLDGLQVAAEARQVRRVDEPLEVGEPQPLRAHRGESQHLPHPVPQEGDPTPGQVVDVDDIGRGAHDPPQHVLGALLPVSRGAVEHHGAHAPAVDDD